MPKEVTIKISGEAGQGMQTIGEALCLLYKNNGLNIFANQDYMSRIRGGNNFFQVRISEEPVYSLRKNSDILVALNGESVAIHKTNLNDNGIIVLDKKKFGIAQDEKNFIDIAMYEMATAVGGSEIFVNAVACGILAALTAIDFTAVENVLKAIFKDKSEEIIQKNITVARQGFDAITNSPKNKIFTLKTKPPQNNFLMNANNAIALGAIKAGCKFYSAYPMTPSTGIMDNMAHYAKKFNIIVEQAEDEIAAINMAIGASFAGVRAMTASSGGGFCLMVEGVSLSGMTETPVVIVDAQRPAPATGFPTRTEQADLDFVLHAAHGEFARVVYTPGSIEEAFYLTLKAFDVAEKYQIPVFIMSDQHLADSYRNIKMFDVDKIKIKRHIISKEESKNIKSYKRYAFTDNGISPRAIPSWIEDVVYADSDEHTEEGHITEDALVRRQMVEKRFYKKMESLKKEIEKPETSGINDTEVILMGFGSTLGVLKEAASAIKSKKVGFIHLAQVWPFPGEEISSLLKGAKKIITVENNAGGQLAGLLRRETGIKVNSSILKFDGRPFDLDYLIEELNKLV
jgi:2-oxoglutarate ferredoxin oxidoreductase subunit alpha